MIEIASIGVLSAFLFSYLSFLWGIQKGLRMVTPPKSNASPSSTVIVAARNEGRSIEQCLKALVRQRYDREKFDIIVVDDHSQDDTFRIANSIALSTRAPRITVLSLKEQSGKPTAISHAVRVARGEIILCTDADCVVPPSWTESMVRCFTPDIAFVAGPVLERPSGSVLSGLQSLEFLSLITTAAGLIGLGKPIICNGASIAYRKSAFELADGFGDHSSSCDDETLMQRMILRNAGRVIFNADSDATVLTSTPATIGDFWQQRTRWGAKKGRYEDSSILRRLIVLYSFFAVVFITGLLAFVEPAVRLPLLGVLLTKALADYFVLALGSRMFRQRLAFGQFLIAELFHVPYIALAALIGQVSSLRWKDRTLKQ